MEPWIQNLPEWDDTISVVPFHCEIGTGTGVGKLKPFVLPHT